MGETRFKTTNHDQQWSACYQRQPGGHGRRRQYLQVPALRQRSRRRHAELQSQQQARLGELQHQYRTPQWHTRHSGQVGTYTGIIITVSDGQDTASLPAFTITVDSASTTGSASLSWVAPAAREDGTPLSLSEIAGFRIYHGTTSGDLTLLHDVSDGSVTTYTVTGLEPTTHYFAVTGYDYEGRESGYSSILSKSMQ